MTCDITQEFLQLGAPDQVQVFNGGALTPNERRQMFGLEPLVLPGMDEPYIDFNKVPIGQSPPLTLSNTHTPPAA